MFLTECYTGEFADLCILARLERTSCLSSSFSRLGLADSSLSASSRFSLGTTCWHNLVSASWLLQGYIQVMNRSAELLVHASISTHSWECQSMAKTGLCVCIISASTSTSCRVHQCINIRQQDAPHYHHQQQREGLVTSTSLAKACFIISLSPKA